MSRAVWRATTRTTVLVILLVAAIITSIAVNAYLAYWPATGATLTTTRTETRTSQINVISVNYTTSEVVASTTVTQSSYETTITETVNNSLSSITVANITTGKFPQSMALNSKTNTLYAMFWNGSNYLAVINANTNSIVTVVPGMKYGALFVNPATNVVYVGNDIINGSSDRIIGQIGVDASIVALDVKRNLLYASNITSVGGTNATTTLYEINATTNAVLKSQTFPGQLLGGVVLDTNTDTLFSTDCTDAFACAPSFILAINASDLSIESKLQLNEIFFAMAFDQQTNLIYVTALQNLLLIINGTNNQLVAKVPVTAYSDEFSGITIDPLSHEILLSGAPYCQGFPECLSNTLYVLSSENYGVFATFVSNDTMRGPVALQFDPVNNETYMAFGYSSFILAVKVPQYHPVYLVP